MILWKINNLKNILSSEGLSQKSCFYYLLLYGLLMTGGMEIMAYFPYDKPNIWRYLITSGYILCAIIGTIFFYKANGGSSGENLIERYISMSIVIMIRLIPILIILMVIIFIYLISTYGEQDTYPITSFEAALTIGWTALYWSRMVKHVKDVANS